MRIRGGGGDTEDSIDGKWRGTKEGEEIIFEIQRRGRGGRGMCEINIYDTLLLTLPSPPLPLLSSPLYLPPKFSSSEPFCPGGVVKNSLLFSLEIKVMIFILMNRED